MSRLVIHEDGSPLRVELDSFAMLMERQLHANDHRPDWCYDSFLLISESIDQQAGNVLQIKMEMDRIEAQIKHCEDTERKVGSMEEGIKIQQTFEELTRQHNQLRIELSRKCANGANYFMQLADNFGLPVPENAPTPDMVDVIKDA